MRKKISLWLAIVVCLALSVTSSQAQSKSILDRLSFRLSGGLGSINGGDMADFAKGINDQIVDKGNTFGYPSEGEIKNPEWGPEWEGEVLLSLSKNFSLGLSVGYLKRKSESSASISVGSDGSASIRWNPKYSAVPVKLSGYYFLPISTKIKAFIKAGAGYYPGKIDFFMRQDQSLLGVSLWAEDKGTGDAGSFGFHGGLGFEFDLMDKVALFVEGAGRYVNFNNWEATNINSSFQGTIEEAGELWYVEALDYITGKYYPGIMMQEQQPTGNIYRNVRKAEISFSGFVFKTGIRIRFGK